jgi:hypothetical protein
MSYECVQNGLNGTRDREIQRQRQREIKARETHVHVSAVRHTSHVFLSGREAGIDTYDSDNHSQQRVWVTQRQWYRVSTYYLSQERIEKRAHGVKCARGKRKSKRDGRSQKEREKRDDRDDWWQIGNNTDNPTDWRRRRPTTFGRRQDRRRYTHVRKIYVDRRERSVGMRDKGWNPLDQVVAVEEATDILPPLYRSWRI